MERDEQLIRQILQGEREKFGELVKRYQRDIYRFLRRMGLDHDEAADVMQNAFVKAYDNLDNLKEIGRFRVWLYTIASNQAKNYLRKFRRESSPVDIELYPESGSGGSGFHVEQEQLKVWINRALARLPEAQRQVVVLRAFENLPFKEVAKLCNMKLSNAKVTYHRALKKMSGWLKPAESEINLEDKSR